MEKRTLCKNEGNIKHMDFVKCQHVNIVSLVVTNVPH
jgi:hypothetical protein